MHHPHSTGRRTGRLLLGLVLASTALCGLAAAPAQAADRGAGLGTWAPLSPIGWHGSLRVGDQQTYCIVPGLPTPTGPTTDHGVSAALEGLSAQQLVSINYLVSTYGQTDDPVQAAAVGWAVKATADRDAALHSWGYRGDSFTEAIDWIMRRAAPDQSHDVQTLAARYLDEAAAIPVPRADGSIHLTTDADDPAHGSVTVDVDATAVGTLRLENAVFSDTGLATRDEVHAGAVLAISATHPDGDVRPYTVVATGSFHVRAAAIRSYTTPGQQSTAGPAPDTAFDLQTGDAEPRPVRFEPHISTHAHISDDGRFVDEVTFSADDGVWPQGPDGTPVPVHATAEVFRTGAFPAESEDAPETLTPVATLQATIAPGSATDSGASPGPDTSAEPGSPLEPGSTTGTRTTVTSEPLPGAGVYTAVWHIDRSAQDVAVAPHLPSGYSWHERFALPTQTDQIVPPVPPVPPVEEEPAPSPAPEHTPDTEVPTSAPTPAYAPMSPPPGPHSLAVTGASAAGPMAMSAVALAVVAGGGSAMLLAARRRRSRQP